MRARARAGHGVGWLAVWAAALGAGCSVPQHYVLGGPDGRGTDATSDLGPGPEAGGDGGVGNDGSDGGAGNDGDAGTSPDASDGQTPADGAMDGGLPYNWPPSASSAAVVCLLVPSCIPSAGTTGTAAQCVDQFLGIANGLRFGGIPDFGLFALVSQIFYCEGVAFDCPSIVNCLSAGATNAVARCDADGGNNNGAYCDGDKILYCNFTGPRVGFDCAQWGLTCREIDMGGYVAAACTNGNTCDPSASSPRCEGDSYVSCDSITMLESAIPCSRAFPNTTCQMVATEGGVQARCVPTGPDCTQANPHCADTNTLVECDPLTHREVRTDCSVLYNSRCETAGATAQCGAAGTACDVNSPDTCTSVGTASVCVNGAFQRVNCSAIGLTNCVSATPPVHCE